jgi:hypothetical protein
VPTPSDARSCACGRTDVVHDDHLTGAPLCVACFKLLGDFVRWLNRPGFDESRHEWEHLWPGRHCDVCAHSRWSAQVSQ